MQNFPHYYAVTATGSPHGDLELTTDHVTMLRAAAPKEFDGPGDRWSPETLLVAAVGDCFVLTFRGIAKNSKLPWTALDCRVTGALDRVDRVTQFTGFEIDIHLSVPEGTDPDAARRVIDKAEQNCLIANSLKGAVHLVAYIDVAKTAAVQLTHA